MKPEIVRTSFFESVRSPREHVLIMGGSQGAQSLDKAITELAPFFAARRLKIVHQCRAESVEELTAVYQGVGVEATVVGFLEKVEEALSWSDLVITRTGAGTTRELLLSGRPTVCVPLPRAEEQHLNAQLLVEAGHGIIVEQGDRFPARLQASIEMALRPENLPNGGQQGAKLKDATAAQSIALGCLQLVGRQ